MKAHLNAVLTVVIVLAAAMAVYPGRSVAAEFHTGSGAGLAGKAEESFRLTIQEDTVNCSTATFSGTASASGTSVTQQLHPEFSGCYLAGLKATVSTAGCQIEANANSNSWNLKSCTNGYTTINWENIWGKCHVDIPNQNGINGFVAVNTNFRNLLTWVFNATNIHVNVTVANGICPLIKGTFTTADLVGVEGITTSNGEIWAE